MKSLFFSILCLFSLHFCQAQTDNTGKALEAIGAFGGATLYNTYVVVGMLADAYTGEVYEYDYASELVGEQINMLNNFKQTLNDLLSSGFLTDTDDQNFAREMIACADLLLAEANALDGYFYDPSDANADAFQTSRTNAWDKVAALLGID
jgi:hypothetical protein